MNFFADATSRKPVLPEDDTDNEKHFVAVNLASVAITTNEAADAAKEDAPYWALHQALSSGTAAEANKCKEYFQYRDQMYPRDGVLLFNDRLVVPKPLRNKVLNVLHAAHQGKLTMLHRSAETVFWPGYTINVEKKQDGCSMCNHNAPSQAQVPTVQSEPPSTPFESIAAEFFDLAGVHYLITVDRL